MDGGVPVVKVRNFDDGRLDLTKLVRTTKEIDAMYKRSRLQGGDILLSIRGSTGLVALVPPELGGGNITQDSARIRIQDASIRDFVVHALSCPYVQRQVALHTVGQAVKGINIASVRQLQIPLPKDENLRKDLTKAFDRLRRVEHLVEDGMQAKRRLKRALLEQMFRDRAGVWSVVRLQDVAEVRTGIAKNGNLKTGGLARPYLRVANVQDGYLNLSEVKSIEVDEASVHRYELRHGDVLMTEGGDFDKLGRGTIWRNEVPGCLHQNHVFAVRTDANRLLPEFLSLLSESTTGRRYFLRSSKQSTNLASVNSTQLRAFPVVLPSIVEQAEIVATQNLLRDAISLLDRQLAAYRQLKRGLMQKLLTGEIDVLNGPDARMEQENDIVRDGQRGQRHT